MDDEAKVQLTVRPKDEDAFLDADPEQEILATLEGPKQAVLNVLTYGTMAVSHIENATAYKEDGEQIDLTPPKPPRAEMN